jgi:uncharacterized protein (TIGR02594 family)
MGALILTPPTWMELGLKELGQAEIPGDFKNNPRIIEYFKACAIHYSKDEVPWCSAYANWVMMMAGKPRTNSAAALSWNTYGKELKIPVYGCIVVFKHHVGFWVEDAGLNLRLLGGNQGNKVSIAPFAKKEVLSYRYPL